MTSPSRTSMLWIAIAAALIGVVQANAAGYISLDGTRYWGNSYYTNGVCGSSPGRIDMYMLGNGEECTRSDCVQHNKTNQDYWFRRSCPPRNISIYMRDLFQRQPFILFRLSNGSDCASSSYHYIMGLQVDNQCHYGYQVWRDQENKLMLRSYTDNACTGDFKEVSFNSEKDTSSGLCQTMVFQAFIENVEMLHAYGTDQTQIELPPSSTPPLPPKERWSLIAGISSAGVLIAGIVGLFVWRRGRSFQVSGSQPLLDDPSGIACGALRIPSEEVFDMEEIGKGGFAVVWKVKYRNKTYASKRLKSSSDQEVLEKFFAEIRLNASLSHPRIVRFIGVAWTHARDIQALFEYMEGGDLRKWLRETRGGPQQCWSHVKFQIAIDIAEALRHVHGFQPPLVHRDLKSGNVMLEADIRAKLGDFGIARTQSSNATMTLGMGTVRWLAPEVIKGSTDYDERADIYAFGVVLSELDTHELPYFDFKNSKGEPLSEFAIQYQITTRQIAPSFHLNCPARILDLANRCLSHDVFERPSAAEIHNELHALQSSWNRY